MTVKDLKNIFRISERNMDFPICIREASIHIKQLEKHWGYWCRYIYINRYMDAPKPVYQNLYELVKEKDYFVLTTNVDHCFQKAGFAKNRIFYTQGDTACFNVVSLVIKKPMTMKKS